MINSKLIKKLLVGTTCAAALMFGSAQASTIQWSLSGVTFNDGGAASGTFSTDSVSGLMSTYNIITSAGSIQPGSTYNPLTSYSNTSSAFAPNSFFVALNNGSHYLNLSFLHLLNSAAGATDAIDTSSQHSYECNNCGSLRVVTGGSAVNLATAVPEPETYALMLAGLGALGFVARRRKAT